MPCALRYAVVVSALMLAGCAGHQRSRPLSGPVHGPSARTAVQSSAGSIGGDAAREDVLLVSHLETAAPDPEHDITLDQIRQYVLDGAAVLVDVRSPESFARGHPRGAINLPAGPVEEMKDHLAQIWPSIAGEELIILYCSGPSCGSAEMVSEYLRGEGFTNTCVYIPGWQMLAKAKDLQ